MSSIPNYDIKILFGDANAKVGNEPGWKQYTGCNSMHNTTNDNGMRLINLASSKNLKIVSTSFPRKDIHKVTWVSPNGLVKNQIDHVLIEERHKSCILDVSSKRGAECGTDHFLIIIKIRLKICKEKREKQNSKSKVDLAKLADKNIRKEFELKLSNRFQALEADKETESSVEDKWEEIKESIQDTAREVIGHYKITQPKKPWFNAECQQMIKERRQIKNDMLNNNNQQNQEKYKNINKKINHKLRTAK